MRLEASSWRDGTMTELQANDLWIKDKFGTESPKEKLDSLFTKLMDRATELLPEATYAARISTLPTIELRKAEARKALLGDIQTWLDADLDNTASLEKVRATGAYNKETDKLYSEYMDGAAAHQAFKLLLDQKILNFYNAVSIEYAGLVAAGGAPAAEWKVTSWQIDRIKTERLREMKAYAMLWVGSRLVDVLVNPSYDTYVGILRNRLGTTLESAKVWQDLEESAFKTALEEIGDKGAGRYMAEPGEDRPIELTEALNIYNSSFRDYKKGLEFVSLSIPCSVTQSHLAALEKILPNLPIEDESLYQQVYGAFYDYSQYRCQVTGGAEEKVPYEHYVSLKGVVPGELRTTYENEIAKENWIELETKAADAGKTNRLDELKTTLVTAMQGLIYKIAGDPDDRDFPGDPWDGPLTRDKYGRIVPYAGIEIGRPLYADWIVTETRKLLAILRKEVISWPEADVQEYVVTQTYIDQMLVGLKRTWDTDPLSGVAIIPGYLDNSVKEPNWRRFKAAVYALEGRRYDTAAKFEEHVHELYGVAIEATITRARELQVIGAEELPPRFEGIEELSKVFRDYGYSRKDISGFLLELDLLNAQIPWKSDYRARFDKVYGTFQDYLVERGGIAHIARRVETEGFYEQQSTFFDNETRYEKNIADWCGQDYETMQNEWRIKLYEKLIALENQELTETEYVGRQNGIVSAVSKEVYYPWRGPLLDMARAKLNMLIDHLRQGLAKPEEIADARAGSELISGFLNTEIMELKTLVEQQIAGGRLVAGLKPFAKFKPLKSTSGFDVEEFSFKHLEKLLKNWVRPRLKDGIICAPKINGYRIILESDGKGDCRIYLEGATKDYSGIYKHIAEELKKLPAVILDGELIERVHGKTGQRSELGKYRRSTVEDTNILVKVFDILYLDDKDLHSEPLEKRLETLHKFFEDHTFKQLEELPAWKVTTEKEFLAKTKQADTYLASEGALYKTVDSKYPLDRRTGEWSKVKKYSDLQVIVLGEKKTKTKDHVYRCGVLVKDKKGLDPKELEELNGKTYLVLGNTFRTSVAAKKGDHLEVSVSEIIEQTGEKGAKLNWMLPKVKDKTERKIDTLAYARQVGQLLQASIDRPWDRLDQILEAVLVVTTLSALRALKAQTWILLTDIYADRVRDYAWSVIDLIRERLGQAPDPIITNRGVEKIYEYGVAPHITEGMLDEIVATYKGLVDDQTSSPQQLARESKDLLDTLDAWLSIAEEPMLPRIGSLSAEIREYMRQMHESGTRSFYELDEALSDLERGLNTLLHERPDTLVDDLADIKRDLGRLIEQMGERKGVFSDRIDIMQESMETVEVPIYTTAAIRDYIRLTGMILDAAIEQIRRGDYSHRTEIVERVPKDLKEFWDELSPLQKITFKLEIDELWEMFESVKDMYKHVSGALFGAKRLDIGCGKSKPNGFIGLDKEPGPWVDKIWDLEKGLPYPDNTMDIIRAWHVLEHLSDPVKIMSEIYRVLKDGGTLLVEIPSSEGIGADADPRHISRWSKHTFAFFTDPDLIEKEKIPCHFGLVRLKEYEDPETGALHTRVTMKAIKNDKMGKYYKKLKAANMGEEEFFQWALTHIKASQFEPHVEWGLREYISDSSEEMKKRDEVFEEWKRTTEFADLVREIGSGTHYEDEVEVPGIGWVAMDNIRPYDQPSPCGGTHCEDEVEVPSRGWVPKDDIHMYEDRPPYGQMASIKLRRLIRENYPDCMEQVDRKMDIHIRAEMEKKGVTQAQLPQKPIELEMAPEQRMAQQMKRNLAVDPFMVKLEEDFGPQGTAPLYQATEKGAAGSVEIGDVGETEGGIGPHHSHCGGYYAGTDAEGYPLFVTAGHCALTEGVGAFGMMFEGREKEIVLPSGQVLVGHTIARDMDTAMIRGNEKITGLQAMPLGSTETHGWVVGVSPLYKEAELLKYAPELESERGPYQEEYKLVNRGRPGWSGSPIVDSLGRVVGVASTGKGREEWGRLDPAWALGYVPVANLQRLYGKAKDRNPYQQAVDKIMDNWNHFPRQFSWEDLETSVGEVRCAEIENERKGFARQWFESNQNELEKLTEIEIANRLLDYMKTIDVKYSRLITGAGLTRDGLYLVKRHADLIANGEKSMILKSKKYDIANKPMYLISGGEIYGVIELGEPKKIDLDEFKELIGSHMVNEAERIEWWQSYDQLWAYEIASFKPYKEKKHYDYKKGVQVVQKDVKPISGAKLTEEGEKSGTSRLDWMEKEPIEIPVKGVLWSHLKGVSASHKSLPLEKLLKLSKKDDNLNIHHDLRFRYGSTYLEGITLYLGSQDEYGKLVDYQGGKLGADIKKKQPVVWNSRKELDKRLFAPGAVGNVGGTKTYGAMFWIDDIEMLPSRIRPKPKGRRYFEFYLKFKEHPELNGLWALSEAAGESYELPFMFWKLKTEMPFHLRPSKKHEKEIAESPGWQRPTKEAIEKFLGHSIREKE